MADFSLVAELKANTSNFVDGIKKGEQSLNNFGSVVDKILGPKGKLVIAIATATTAAIKFGQQMNASMAEIAKGTGATGEQLEKLRENVHDSLINGVARSAQEVGTMIADLNTRFKVTGNELNDLTVLFDKFSTVTGVETKNAINQTADVMAKWNIAAEDTDDLLNQLTKASQDSGIGIEELLSGLKQGQAVFSQFGMSATDTIAYMASLKENGVESAQALIAMKTALANFSQQGLDAEEAFKNVSESIKNAKTETEALGIATSTFGARNGAEMVRVLRNGADSADAYKTALLGAGLAIENTEEAARTSKDAFADMVASLQGTFGGFGEGFDELFKGVIDSVTSVIRTLAPILRPVVNIVRDILSTVGSLASEITNAITELVGEGTGFKRIATVLQSVYEVIHTTLGYVLESFKTVFGLIFSIINGKWDLAWEYLKKSLLLSVDFVLDIISKLINGIKDQFNVLIEKAINPIIEKVNWWQEKLNKPLTEKLELIGDLDLSKLTGVQGALDKVNKKIEQLSGKTQKTLTGDLGKVKDATKEVGDAAEKTTEVYSKKFTKAIEKVAKGYEKIEDATEAFGVLSENVLTTAAETGVSVFGELFSMLGEELVSGEVSFQNYAATAVEGIAKVLTSLGQELIALSVARAANYDYGTATLAAAGAAAAFVASGAMSAVASSLKSQAEAAVLAASGLKKLEEFLDETADTTVFSEYFENIASYATTLADYENQIVSITQAITAQEGAAANAQKALDDWHAKMSIGTGIMSAISPIAGILNSIAQSITEGILKDEVNKQIKALQNLKGNLAEVYEAIRLLNERIKEYAQDVLNNIKAVNTELKNSIANYQLLYSGLSSTLTEALVETVRSTLLTQLQDIYEDLQNVGVDIGGSFIDGIIDGATSSDFATELKSYIRENLVKITIYTSEFTDKMSSLGQELITAITLQDYNSINTIKSSMVDLYNVASEQAEAITSVLDGIFDDVIENTDEAVSYVTSSVDEMGESISETLINSIENGLDQSEFLDSMKNYIRKMVIQTVVYTESLQSQIEAIGEAISKGISDGFSETGLDELRMDFSYLFYQAENAMSKVDSVLDSVFTGYATGTQNATRGLHLVGEAGPELVRFNGGEEVYNAMNTRQMLSGSGSGGNNFNISFYNTQDTTAYTMLQQLKQYNREMAINGIM